MGLSGCGLQFGRAEGARLRCRSRWLTLYGATTMRAPRAGLRCLVVPTLTTVVLAAAACHTPTLSDLELDECPSTVPVVAGVIVSVSDSTVR